MDPTALLLIAGAGLLAGGIAAIVGFGIGSIFTPLLSLWLDARVAVAAISIPHLIGTGLRFLLLEGRVDRHVLWLRERCLDCSADSSAIKAACDRRRCWAFRCTATRLLQRSRP